MITIRDSGRAPAAINVSTTLICFLLAASLKADSKFCYMYRSNGIIFMIMNRTHKLTLFLIFTLAPASISALTTSLHPCLEASMKAVSPLCRTCFKAIQVLKLSLIVTPLPHMEGVYNLNYSVSNRQETLHN